MNCFWNSFSIALFVVVVAGTSNEDQQCRLAEDPLDLYNDVAIAQFKPWRETGIDKDLVTRAAQIGIARGATHYQIIGGKLFRNPEPCKFPARCEGTEHFLTMIAHKLPDLDFVVNYNDWPLTTKHDPLPIFSFSTIPDHHSDVLCPNWAFWEGGPYLKVIPTWRWDINRPKLLAAGDAVPWPDKEDLVFFRGSRTNGDRDSLLLHSHKHADRWDAKFTLNQSQQATKYITETLGITPADHISPEEHCKYRYLINFDGVAASFRLRDILACGSTVLYVNPTWVEFFYSKLNPWEHYIPLDIDAEKAQKVVGFLWDHTDLARRVAKSGRDFIEKNLTLEHVERYWLQLLKEYASLLRFRPEKNATYVEVKSS